MGTIQKIMMAVIISTVAFGASYHIITADQPAKLTDAVLVMGSIQP